MEVPVLRKILGIATAAAAGLLLVGVAWAAGDRASGISSNEPQVTAADSSGTDSSAGSSVTSSGSVVTAPSGTDASTPTSSAVTAPSTSTADNSTTSISIVDTSSTSTTIDATTSTSQAGGSTSTTVDDNNRQETRGPAPLDTAPTSYQVGAAGSVTVQISAGRLILIAATAAPGWAAEVDRADGERVEVDFENGGAEAEFEARVHNGELRTRIEPS